MDDKQRYLASLYLDAITRSNNREYTVPYESKHYDSKYFEPPLISEIFKIKEVRVNPGEKPPTFLVHASPSTCEIFNSLWHPPRIAIGKGAHASLAYSLLGDIRNIGKKHKFMYPILAPVLKEGAPYILVAQKYTENAQKIAEYAQKIALQNYLLFRHWHFYATDINLTFPDGGWNRAVRKRGTWNFKKFDFKRLNFKDIFYFRTQAASQSSTIGLHGISTSLSQKNIARFILFLRIT